MPDAETAAAAAAGDSDMLPLLLLLPPLLPLLLVVLMLGRIAAAAKAACWGASSCVQAQHGMQINQHCCCTSGTVHLLGCFVDTQSTGSLYCVVFLSLCSPGLT
jgi:hypothetical protein